MADSSSNITCMYRLYTLLHVSMLIPVAELSKTWIQRLLPRWVKVKQSLYRP